MTQWYFQDSPTAAEIGRKGAEALKEKHRAPIRRKTDELRERLGMPPIEWRRG